ncbi:MAG: hypothetical protein U1F70_01790 [Candidatus Competibacteraceae bacterium]
MHRTTPRFWKHFENLPAPVREVAEKNFELLRTDPTHPSLHFKRVGKLWSVRAGSNHRALAIEDGDDYIWVWIGVHDEYERIIKNQT